MAERLLMIQNHIRDKDDSEYIDSYPFMNKKQRSKYLNSSFQCGLKFPLTEGNIVLDISPRIYNKCYISNSTKSLVENVILQNFVNDEQTNLVLDMKQDWGNSLFEDQNYDHIILIDSKWNEIIEETIELIRRLQPATIISMVYKEITILDCTADIVVVPYKNDKIISVSSNVNPPPDWKVFKDDLDIDDFYRTLDPQKRHYKIKNSEV